MPCFQAHQPTPPSSSPPASESPFCNVPCFQAHQPIPPSSSPPGSESSFAMSHVSALTNPLLPLSPLQQVGCLIHYPHGQPPHAQCTLVHWSLAPSTHPSICPPT